MSLNVSGFAQQMESSCSINEGEGDYFELLGLPDEMIERVFSFLDVEDGMRMRLNKRLSKIESKSKYYVERAILDQEPFNGICNKCVTIKNRKYPLDFLVRIAQHASIGKLEVFLRISDELNSKFLDLIKEFNNIKGLYLGIVDNDIMSDSLFLDLTGRCNNLHLAYWSMMNLNNISSESFYQMYKSMNDGSTILRKIFIDALIGEEKLNSFLNSLGITCRSGRIISNRNIEVYKDNAIDLRIPTKFYVNIFDGLFHIMFFYHLIGSSTPYTFFIIKLYENLESLNNAKSAASPRGREWTRMNVYSE